MPSLEFQHRLPRALLLIVLVGAWGVSGAQHRVGGKTSDEVFANSRLAELAEAACMGEQKAVARMVGAGVDVNGVGLQGSTPLLWAISCENVAGIEALLRAGADPNKRSTHFTAVYAAATRHNPKPLAVLLKYGGDADTEDNESHKTALQEAMSLGIHGHGWDNYYALLEKADINRADERGRTIATYASDLNQYEKVAELLERGYSYDLDELGRSVQTGHVDLEPSVTWQRKVREMLEARGVRFPVPRKQR